MAKNAKTLLKSCKARAGEETAQLFKELIEAYKDYYLDQYIYSESEYLTFRQGQVLALKALYDDLSAKSGD